jgi:hypothetical protein
MVPLSSKKKTETAYCSDSLVTTLNSLWGHNTEDLSVNTSCMCNNNCFIRHLREERVCQISLLSIYQNVMLNVYLSIAECKKE